ncbi:hypothetical protein [Oligoflexus tunisiensis]|uniref:hypothetical protein n=1 Tax=Oligoflexus tunisiensis TaxID=708132 RepID=UPI00114CBC2B|nr:hypothetical protein [Oligoflexus tunisiensis]
MVRISFLFLMALLPACKTSSTSTTMAAAKTPDLAAAASVTAAGSLDECDNLQDECPTEERNLPYQCVAYRLAGKLLWQEERVYAWGPSLCQARQGLRAEACARKLSPAALGGIHCGPDATAESCPVVRKNCPKQGKAARCVARRYKDQDIPWSERPMAWAANECNARELMLVSACQRGLNPNDLGDISCIADPAPGACPPTAPACDDTTAVPTVCQVSTIGDITLKKPWTAEGVTACEAQHRLKELACRFADGAKKLTPEQLGSMQCRSLMDQP